MHFPRRFVLLSLVMCLAAILPAIASAAPCVSGQTGPATSQVRIFTPPNDEYCTLVDLTGCSPWVAAHWELFWPTACTIPAQAYFRAAVETPPASGCFKPGAQVGPSYNYSLVGVASSNVDHVSPAMWNPGPGRYFVCVKMLTAGDCVMSGNLESPDIRLDGTPDACTSYNIIGVQNNDLITDVGLTGNPVMFVQGIDTGSPIAGQTGPGTTSVRYFTPPNDEYDTFVDLGSCATGGLFAHWELFWGSGCTVPVQAFFRTAVETPAGSGCFVPGTTVGSPVSYDLVGVAGQVLDHISPKLVSPGAGKWFVAINMVSSGDCTFSGNLENPQLRLDGSPDNCQSYNLYNATTTDLIAGAGLPGNPVMFVSQQNHAPDVSLAAASPATLSPADHKFRAISIVGVTDPECDPVSITVTGVTQDEPVVGKDNGHTCPDALISAGNVSVRAERYHLPGAKKNGRVYVISFTADDGKGGVSNGSVQVCVPREKNDLTCVSDPQIYVSTAACPPKGSHLDAEALSGDSEGDGELSLQLGRVTASQAELSFEIPEDAQVDLSVYDVAGRKVASIENSVLTSGVYDRVWRMDGVSKGLYFVRMHVGDETVTTRVLKLN